MIRHSCPCLREWRRIAACALFAGVWCACEEPRLDVRFDIPDAYVNAVSQISLLVLRPSDDVTASFTCEELAMGDVPEDVLRASQIQEVRVARGEVADIAALDREGQKILYARGIAANQETIVAACQELGTVGQDIRVRLLAEPVTVLQANGAARPDVTVRNALGEPLVGAEVKWRFVGADGIVSTGTAKTDEAGVASVAVGPANLSGPTLLDIVSRWQREPLLLSGFQWPSQYEKLECKSFWPGYPGGDPRGTWARVRLGRLGPAGEIGFCSLVDPSSTPSDECPQKLSTCLSSCAGDTQCESGCNDAYAICEAPYLDVRWRKESGGELSSTLMPLGQLGKRTTAANWQLALVPGEIRERVFLFSLGTGSAWYELDPTGKVLLRHTYVTPWGKAKAQQFAVVPHCSGQVGSARILALFADGEVRLYEPEGGEPLEEEPLSDLVQSLGSLGDRAVVASGCIGEIEGNDEYVAVLLGAQDGGQQTIVIEVGPELVIFDWSRRLSAFGAVTSRSDSEHAALLFGQMGTGNAEVIRVRLQRAEPVSDSVLSVDATDALLAMPSYIDSGELDGHSEAGADADLVALVSFANSTSGSADHFAQIVSGHEYKGQRLVGLFPLASKDTSGLTPHMMLSDLSGDGIDDLVVLRRSDQSDPTVHALLSIYTFGK